ncbi:glycosyltransferase family 39 protein [Candidatus Viridilinea mediisalina]|uniref:Uncharacterized protein n=1 Tax=Candidatus Viridilinea mediisalina TaxID=2024553 RepID=A0A2A6RPE8_9CHLR|nr:glycosyltransferase family 39 protein [Candidatus Viridilinea mediisalina]PDW04823.1 hypothetical protein CJ255_01915 [Candidatus Viridilinea mediisalina]
MRQRSLWLGFGSFLVWALLYLLTLTDVHTYDALSYILDVERKPWRELFHPHHLAYGPLGALVHGLATAFGWAHGAERPLQVMNALAGALGCALFVRLVAHTLPQRTRAAALAGLLLGASYAYWYYAIEVEVYTIAAIFLILALGLMLQLAQRPHLGLALALGLTQGLAVLFHQSNVLLSLPALVALLLGLQAAGQPLISRSAVRLLLAYGAPLALIVAGAYVGIGLGLSGLRDWASFYGWAAGYATTGFWGGPLGFERLPLLGQGLADTFAHPGGALVGLLLLVSLLLRWRSLQYAPRGVLPLTLSWLAIYAAFFIWWEPDNIEFWIASLPPFYLLLLTALFAPAPPQAVPQATRWLPLLVLLCGLWMLGANLTTIRTRGDAERDLQRVVAAALAAASEPGDLLVLPDDLLELYLPFYEQREQVISLNQAVALVGSDWPRACAAIQERIELALVSGYAVIVAADALRPPPAAPGDPPTPAQRLGLTPDMVERCYEPYVQALQPLDLGIEQQVYFQLPAVQQLATGPGWDFRQLRWGWRLHNGQDHGLSEAGWAITPELDPYWLSPPMHVQTSEFAALELRFAATTAARDAQLFFLDQTGQTAEERSLRWDLHPGPELQTYCLVLQGAPGWEGLVTGLRLDPVGIGDGGRVVLESIRFVDACTSSYVVLE